MYLLPGGLEFQNPTNESNMQKQRDNLNEANNSVYDSCPKTNKKNRRSRSTFDLSSSETVRGLR